MPSVAGAGQPPPSCHWPAARPVRVPDVRATLACDEAILTAARDLLTTLGYRRLAVDAVARRAGVSRTTVRLRWSSKAELVFDAVAPDPRVLEVPDTGSLEGNLRGCVDNTVQLFRSAPMRAAFQGLLDDARNHPDVARALRERIYGPATRGFSELVERAAARGESAGRSTRRCSSTSSPARCCTASP